MSQAPASVSVIVRKQLAQRAYKDITDALRDVPGVTVERDGGGERRLAHADAVVALVALPEAAHDAHGLLLRRLLHLDNLEAALEASSPPISSPTPDCRVSRTPEKRRLLLSFSSLV